MITSETLVFILPYLKEFSIMYYRLSEIYWKLSGNFTYLNGIKLYILYFKFLKNVYKYIFYEL